MKGEDEPPEVLAAQLTQMFSDQAASATGRQRASVRRWQGKDRFYQQVQRAAAQLPTSSEEAHTVMDDLISLAQPLKQNVLVWRGVRSIETTFGRKLANLEELVGETREAERFLATSTNRAVAEHEFPEPATSPALLRVLARRGTHAVWVPPLGDEEFAGQLELLFLPTAEVRILDIDRSEALPIVFVEVSDG